MAFGNVPFSTLYDHSEGAFRRRIILTTKPKQEGRRDDRDLPDKILQGKSGVFNWMLEGLSRLTSNGWEFTISQRARENLEETKQESFNLLGFLADENACGWGIYLAKSPAWTCTTLTQPGAMPTGKSP